jgi:simple sugar transport system ATP-binding protein
LSVGEQLRVELVKTLCLGARFLILDEPTSALTRRRPMTDRTAEADEQGIVHHLHQPQAAEVKDLSSKVAILRHGKVVFQGHTKDHSSSDIAALMTGHEVVSAQ